MDDFERLPLLWKAEQNPYIFGMFAFYIISMACLVGYLSECQEVPTGILYPRESETREVTSLDGLWNFRLSPTTDHKLGFDMFWYKRDLAESGAIIQMPVPASYNDITQDREIRDHVGLAWYDRKFFVSDIWRMAQRKVWLRFGSVSYSAQVWINGEFVVNHDIGHLPFAVEITRFVLFGKQNRITVAVDNMLRADTVPQGSISEMATDNGKKLVQRYTFDFFNYAGIHRPVLLYTTPAIFIDDINVQTDIEGDTGIVNYTIKAAGNNSFASAENIQCAVALLDRGGKQVAFDVSGNCSGSLRVPLARFWWPYLMDPDPGYLYTLEIRLRYFNEVIDYYRQPVGIRTLKWTNTTFLINNRPLYLHGFGKHEDSDLRGKGLDMILVAKDYNLIKWVGANVFRTSHYPYAEEIMDMADRMGIMVINECPSVDTDGFTQSLLEKHKQSLTELYKRDKNRPGVIAWSLANEPRTQANAAENYFGNSCTKWNVDCTILDSWIEEVAKHMRSLDTSRPLTIAIARGYFEDKAGKHLDLISFNRYNGWYSNSGELNMITQRVVQEAEAWHTKYNKPVMMMEYGADTYEGLHLNPEYVWSEDYQVELMSRHFQAFDELRKKGWFIGEFIWNFADFKTAQTTTRVGGNKKGIFTRSRQPKASAYHLRRRYLQLANEIYKSPIPNDLYPYDVQTKKIDKTEL